MNKVLIGLVSGVALFGLAACSDTDETTTQGVDTTTEPAPADGGATTAPEPVEPDTGGAGGG